MRICLVTGNESTRAAVLEQCESEVQVECVQPHEVLGTQLPEDREHEIIERLATADGLLFEWDVMRSHLMSGAQNLARHLGIPVVALCADDPKEYSTALLAGADAVTSHPVDPVVLKSMVVAHRRTLQVAHEVAAILAETADADLGAPGTGSVPALSLARPGGDGAEDTPAYLVDKPYRMGLMGVRLDLSQQQHELMKFFRERANETVTREEILEAVWGVGFNPGTNVVDVAIHYLRKALREHGLEGYLETVRGQGYRLRIPVEEQKAA